MSFDVRCPSCNVKLRLAEKPKPGVMIDCPKCAREFEAPDKSESESAAASSKAPTDNKPKEKKVAKNKTVTTKEREFRNEFALLGIVGGCTFLAFGLMFGIWMYLNQAGRTQDLIACVPDNYSMMAGVHVEQMSKLPEFKSSITDKIYTGNIHDSFSKVAAGLGLDPENAVSFMVYATSADSKLFIFRTRKKFSPSSVSSIAGINADGTFPANHPASAFAGGAIECPTNKIVIIAVGKRSDARAAAELAKNKNKDGMQNKIGATGKLAIRSHFFRINMGKPPAPPPKVAGGSNEGRSGIERLDNAYYGTTVFATWCTFGGTGMRIGAGVEMSDEDKAKDIATMLRDRFNDSETSDPPNEMRTSIPISGVKKEFGEFMQYVKFKSKGNCAYLESKIESESGRTMFFDVFIGPNENSRTRPAN